MITTLASIIWTFVPCLGVSGLQTLFPGIILDLQPLYKVSEHKYKLFLHLLQTRRTIQSWNEFTASNKRLIWSVEYLWTREVLELNPPEVSNSVLQFASWGVRGQQLVSSLMRLICATKEQYELWWISLSFTQWYNFGSHPYKSWNNNHRMHSELSCVFNSKSVSDSIKKIQIANMHLFLNRVII